MEYRDYKNYNGQTVLIKDYFGKNGMQAIFVIASNFSLSHLGLNLQFQGWDNSDAFDRRREPNQYFNRSFSVQSDELETLKKLEAEMFLAIDTLAFEFLEMSADDYAIQSISIDVSELSINVSAKHKQRSQYITRSVNTPEEFETVKQNNFQFVGILLQFAWGYGRANDDFLKSLNPVSE